MYGISIIGEHESASVKAISDDFCFVCESYNLIADEELYPNISGTLWKIIWIPTIPKSFHSDLTRMILGSDSFSFAFIAIWWV